MYRGRPGRGGCFAVAVLTFRNIFPANRGLAAVVAVPDRDLMAPPELAADAPVVDIFQPMVVNLDETIRDEFRVAIFDGLKGGFGQRFHLDEPLLGDEGFDRRLAARAMADGMGQFFDMIEEAQFFQVSDDGFTAIFTGHAVVFRTGFSFIVPSRFMIMMDSRLWRWPISKSFGS